MRDCLGIAAGAPPCKLGIEHTRAWLGLGLGLGVGLGLGQEAQTLLELGWGLGLGLGADHSRVYPRLIPARAQQLVPG